jgi:hypothetical protein
MAPARAPTSIDADVRDEIRPQTIAMAGGLDNRRLQLCRP